MSSTELPIGILTTDEHLVVRTWDPWLVASTGLAAEDVLGRGVADIIPELAERGLLAILESVLADGTVQVLAPALHHYVIPCKPSQASRTFERMQQHVTIGPLRDGDRIVGVIVGIEDVTARIEQEREWAEQLGAGSPTSGHIESLTRLLGDHDRRTRQTAVTTLAGHGEAIVEAFVRTLREQHHDFNVLSSALDVLAMSDVDVVSPLLPLLEDADANLRIQVALILGVRGDSRAIPSLAARLSDPDPNVRFHVIEALGNLRATEATEALLHIAEQRDFFLSYPAIVALGRIGHASVAPFLAPLLTDQLLRAPVIEALGELGDEDVCIPLVNLLGRDAPADVVADALAGLYERYESRYGAGEHIAALVRRHITAAGTQSILDAVQQVGPDRLPGLARVLGWLEGEAVQRALALLLGHEAVQAQVVEALVRYGAGVVALLIEQLGAEDLETRQAATVALGRIGDGRATGALVKALSDPELALLAAGALARIGDPDAFEALLPLVGHADPAIRQAAVGALNSIGHADMPQRIRDLLDSPDPRVRESAVKIAGYFGYDECIDRVLECCGSDIEAVRRSAVEHLAYFEDSRVLGRIVHALGHDTAPVRAVAVSALARLESPVSTRLLIDAVHDPDPWVRYVALRAVGNRGSLDAVPAVIAALEDDQAGQVRLAAIEALGRLKPTGTFEILEPFTRSNDEDLARTAIHALGGLGSSQALSALEEFLRAPERWRRSAAIEAIVMRQDLEVVATIQWRAAADEDDAVVAAAFEALVRIATRQGRQGSEAARGLLELATEPSRRQSAVASLSLLPAWRIPDVAAGLRHRTIEGRQAAVEALGRMKHPEASKVLETALDDGVAIVRLRAVAELKHLGIQWCQRKLMTLARTDPDAEVRSAAMMAVARVADDGQ